MNLGWRVAPLDELVDRLTTGARPGRPAVVAVNGHSSSGKTTLAGRLAAALPDAAVLHTDDLAWHRGVFTWDELLRDEVLPVVRAGEPLDYRPPQWQARGRTDSITLPGGLACLLVEGVGASQASVRDHYDLVIWVETDEPTRSARDVVRLAAGEMSAAGFEPLDGRGERVHHPGAPVGACRPAGLRRRVDPPRPQTEVVLAVTCRPGCCRNLRKRRFPDPLRRLQPP